MAALTRAVVQCLGVLRAALIPHHDGSWLIPYATSEVSASVDMVKQELQHIIRLLLIPADDTLCIRRVDEQALSLCDGMHDDHWVHRLCYRSSQNSLVAVVTDFTHDWIGGGMNRCKTLETLSKGRRQTVKSTSHLKKSAAAVRAFDLVPT
jgi:hypothetical protein